MQEQTRSKLNRCNTTQKQYNQAYVSANRMIFHSGRPNIDQVKWPVDTNWDIGYLNEQLSEYNDHEIIPLLKYGFPIEFDYSKVKYDSVPSKNHGGACTSPIILMHT